MAHFGDLIGTEVLSSERILLRTSNAEAAGIHRRRVYTLRHRILSSPPHSPIPDVP